MKFTQLSEGQAFEYQGRVYTKKGPLMAVGAGGASKLIPRSAAIKPLAPTETPSPTEERRQVELARVMNAFEAFYSECRQRLRGSGADDRWLEEARERFIQAIKN